MIELTNDELIEVVEALDAVISARVSTLCEVDVLVAARRKMLDELNNG